MCKEKEDSEMKKIEMEIIRQRVKKAVKKTDSVQYGAKNMTLPFEDKDREQNIKSITGKNKPRDGSR